MHVMTGESAAAVRGWLMSPRSDAGVHLANDQGGWDFVSYPTLADQGRRIARRLVDEGAAGEPVGVLMPTSHLCLATMFAVLAAGGTLVPITPPQFEAPRQYADRLRGVLRASGARVLVSAAAFGDIAAQTLAAMSAQPNLVLLDDVPDLSPLDELVAPGRFALLQMTSGSTGFPRAVRVSWRNLAANLDALQTMCATTPADRGTSWLPLYHDMGLIGGVFQSICGQHEMRLLRPDQFIRDPLRWLRAAAASEHTGSPSFGLDYVSRRLTPADLGDLDLSGLRTMVVGADRIDPAHLRAFTALTAGHGFNPRAFLPAYGLAEMTLIATGQRLGEPIRMTRVDRSTLCVGHPVRVVDSSGDGLSVEPSGDWVVSVGHPAPGHDVRIVDGSGQPTTEGTLGEIVLCGPSVTHGYRGDHDGATRFDHGALYTGDAGFLIDGQLHVFGRMGTSLKVNGRSVFAEDLDVLVAEVMAVRPGRLYCVAVNDGDVSQVAVFLDDQGASEQDPAISACITALRGQLGDQTPLWVVRVPRGGLLRTTSGKPRRADMWQQWRSGRLRGAELLAYRDRRHDSVELGQVRALLEKAHAVAVIPDDATVHFEGSLAEGFGNEGSDIDLLLIVPGSEQAVMPTVLFLDGRRVEIRCQSHEQIRTRLLRVRQAIDTGSHTGVTEDLLNRVQRFLHGMPLRVGPGYEDLIGLLSSQELSDLIARWWLRRAGHCLRYSAAMALLDHPAEAVNWAREGLVQAMKGFLARRGEDYLEVKWVPLQVARLRTQAGREEVELLEAYQRLEGAGGADGRDRSAADGTALIGRMLDLATGLGAPTVRLDPGNVMLKRVPGVTTWPIGSTTHVVRDKAEVFVLSAECAASWRRVVFGQTLATTSADRRHLRLFARHGFIALGWRGAGVLRPAAAMCGPDRPLTPVPSVNRPVITIDGAPPDGDIARSPLSARAFAECAGALMLANMVAENAREDFDGAVRDGQWGVASLCGRRIAVMAVRMLASAWGVSPLPADPTLLDLLGQLVPEHRDLATTARGLSVLSVRDRDEALRAGAELEAFVARVREATAGQAFPASFASADQWQATIRRGYQWLRMGGYLGAYVELDEVRDLLTSGGVQPGARASSGREQGECG